MKVTKELKELMVFKDLRVSLENMLDRDTKDTKDFKVLMATKVIRDPKDLHQLCHLF
jgi:hypothetical protein